MNASAARGSRCDLCGTEYPPGVSLCPKDGTPTQAVSVPEARHPMQGQFAGSYKLIRPIGAGASGEVFLAEHPTLAKRVAVKLLRPALSKERELVKRFFAEAQAVAHLRHPGLVQIYDLSVTPEGRAYYVMDYLEGQSLARYLRQRGKLAPSEGLPLLIELLDVLRVAHEAGIIHRDLKPENIFLKDVPKPPRVALLDFGIAKFLNHHVTTPALSLPGARLGTPQYMSPEQIAGRPVGPASDLYAVGVLLFEVLTGELPFRDEPLSKRTGQDAARLRHALPSASRALDEVYAKALAPTPDDRYQSAAEMALALADALEDPEEPLALTNPKVLLPPRAPEDRRPAPAALVTQPELSASAAPLAADPRPDKPRSQARAHTGAAPPALENDPTTARPASRAWRPADKPAKPNAPPSDARPTWTLWASLSAALLLGALALSWDSLRAPPAPAPPPGRPAPSISVESTPADAAVTLSVNGAQVASRPGTLRYQAAPGASVVVEVQKPGYQTARLAFVAESDRTLIVQLTPLPKSASQPAPSPAPAPPNPADPLSSPSPAPHQAPATPKPPPQRPTAPGEDALDAPQDTQPPRGLPAPSDALDAPQDTQPPNPKKPKRNEPAPNESLD